MGVGSILSQASSLLRCISLDRFRAVPDEDQLAHEAANLAILNEFTAGLVFLNDGTSEESITNIRYKIRMDIDNAPTTARLKNYLWIPGPEDSFLEDLRYFRGFVQLQDIVSQAIIQVAKESTGQTRYKREAVAEDKWAVYTQQMPYPCYRKDYFQTSLYESQALIVAFFFSMLFSVASIVRFLVADRETGNTMLMGVMGVKVSYCTISWVIWSSIELAVTYGCICAVLEGGGILPRTPASLLLTLLILAQISGLSFWAIWSLIVKLRKDRTVLLTTHHLDEAELLSDNLVIMHRGQVHSTGSPVEIKRTLGSGYNLSVTYPSTWTADEEDEERAKLLLATARQAVPNASLTNSTGLETELLLPFYDNNGVNNDYLQLCLLLESQQQALGFSSFTLECSSLEQILADICQQTDRYEPVDSSELACKSNSSCSVRTESAPLVTGDGPLKGSVRQQFIALMRARALHYMRNTWLLFVLLVVPAAFVCIAMGFSKIRPPADNERPLLLTPALYNATDFLTSQPSIYSENVDPWLAKGVMRMLLQEKDARNWTENDNPVCECGETRQVCYSSDASTPQTMVLPDVDTLNRWLLNTQEMYREKRRMPMPLFSLTFFEGQRGRSSSELGDVSSGAAARLILVGHRIYEELASEFHLRDVGFHTIKIAVQVTPSLEDDIYSRAIRMSTEMFSILTIAMTIAFVILQVLQVSTGDGDLLPSGEPSAPMPPII
ncbi:hypothetical protein evm_013608 [Chilo suppressalis]|nr:hypothetical protein evm_013608 [Chilo suppressalis]